MSATVTVSVEWDATTILVTETLDLEHDTVRGIDVRELIDDCAKRAGSAVAATNEGQQQ